VVADSVLWREGLIVVSPVASDLALRWHLAQHFHRQIPPSSLEQDLLDALAFAFEAFGEDLAVVVADVGSRSSTVFRNFTAIFTASSLVGHGPMLNCVEFLYVLALLNDILRLACAAVRNLSCSRYRVPSLPGTGRTVAAVVCSYTSCSSARGTESVG
jgi:hypothetical protein